MVDRRVIMSCQRSARWPECIQYTQRWPRRRGRPAALHAYMLALAYCIDFVECRLCPLLWKWRTASSTFYEVDEKCVDSPFESSSSSDSNHDEVVIRDLEEEQDKGDPIVMIVEAAGSCM